MPAIGRLLDVHGPACDDHLLGISGPYTDSDTIPRIEIRIRIGKVEIDFLRNRHNYTFLKWSMSDVGRAACRLVARHGAPHNALSPSRRRRADRIGSPREDLKPLLNIVTYQS